MPVAQSLDDVRDEDSTIRGVSNEGLIEYIMQKRFGRSTSYQ